VEKDLLADPPSRDDLERWSRSAPGGVRGMVARLTQMEDYQVHIAGKEDQLSDSELLDLLARVPNLLHKPILTDGARAHQGFNPETLQQFVQNASAQGA